MDSSPLSQFAARLVHCMDGRDAALDFEALALELFHLQFAHNATYAKVCRSLGRSPGTVGHWREIPALPTVAFKELEVTAIAPGSRIAVFHSSGTTSSQSSRHFHCVESMRLYEASARAWFTRHLPAKAPSRLGRAWFPSEPQTDDEPGPVGGAAFPRAPMRECGALGEVALPREFQRCRESYRVWSLTPPPALVPHSSLVHMFGAAGEWLGDPQPAFWGAIDDDGAWRVNVEGLLSSLGGTGVDPRPVVLLGTAFLFVHLLDALESAAAPVVLPAGSWVLETGGYKGRSRTMTRQQLHGEITRRLGVNPGQIVCEYGMSELSSQAYALHGGDAPASSPDRCFRFPPWVRTVIRSPETGREVPDGTPGLLQIWDLANVWSVMGIQTEDLATSWSGAFELHGRAAAAPPRGCSLMAA